MSVRKMSAGDVKQVSQLVLQASRESPVYDKYGIDVNMVVSAVVSLSGSGVSVVYEDNGTIVGVLLGYVGTAWFVNKSVVEEKLLYVLPEYRGTNVATELINEFTNLAKSFQPIKISAGGSLHPDKFKSLEKLYEKCGYKISGITMDFGG